MNFTKFAESHGLIMRETHFNRWVRVPTSDKPHHRNGAYIHYGTHAVLQNHATMTECAIWQNKDSIGVEQHVKSKTQIDRQLLERQESAARKAAWILGQCVYEQHAYLDGKGFPDETGLVWNKSETENLLCIPMRVKRNLVGVQIIDRDGIKKFLFGQRCGLAEYIIDAKGPHILCEGFATGLSIRSALHALGMRYTIHICFSAGNMAKIASHHPDACLVADNDLSGTGERIALSTGLPYYMPPEVGQDFNDLWKEIGNFRSGQILRKFMQGVKKC